MIRRALLTYTLLVCGLFVIWQVHAQTIGEDVWKKAGAAGPPPPAVDGTPQCTHNASTATATLTMTTSSTNDIIYLGGIANGIPQANITVSDGATLTWNTRQKNTSGASLYTWTAKSSGTLSSDVVTLSWTGAVFNSFCAWAISGADFASPFDPNASVPVWTSTDPGSVTTTNPADMIIGCARFGATGTPSAGSGFTLIGTPTGLFAACEYKTVTTTQSSLSVGWTTGAGDANGMIVDAITAN